MDSVVHFEIPVDELERAKGFYKEMFDWELEDIPQMDYTIARTSECDENKMPKKIGTINGGIRKRMNEKDSPLIVVDVKSIDNTLEKAKAKGSKVVLEKNQVGDMGYYAIITDSEGNLVGVWQNLKEHHKE